MQGTGSKIIVRHFLFLSNHFKFTQWLLVRHPYSDLQFLWARLIETETALNGIA